MKTRGIGLWQSRQGMLTKPPATPWSCGYQVSRHHPFLHVFTTGPPWTSMSSLGLSAVILICIVSWAWATLFCACSQMVGFAIGAVSFFGYISIRFTVYQRLLCFLKLVDRAHVSVCFTCACLILFDPLLGLRLSLMYSMRSLYSTVWDFVASASSCQAYELGRSSTLVLTLSSCSLYWIMVSSTPQVFTIKF